MERITLPPSRRWPPRGITADRLLAAALVVFGVVEVITVGFGDRTALVAVVTAAHCASLAWRRSFPLAALAGGSAAMLLLTAVDLRTDDLNASALPWVLLMYSVAMWAPLRTALVGLVVAAATAATGVVSQGTVGEDFVFATAVVGIAWGLGRAMRARVGQVGRLTEDVVRSELALEAQRVAVVTEERHRIARELHDIVSHGLGVMVVQAAAAESVVGDAPDAARDAMQAVQEVGRQAQAEMVRMVGLLRDDAASDGIAPQPSMADVAALVARTRSAGLPVELRETEVGELPAGLSLTGYRVVQEALTNVARHAPGAETIVEVAREYGHLRVSVVNAPPAAVSAPVKKGAGHGLVGMRERVATWGGRLEAEPTADGGFRVRVELPVDAA